MSKSETNQKQTEFKVNTSKVKTPRFPIFATLMKDKTLIVVTGPTAVGKTGVAVRLAQELGTEIVSADSRQIFRELEIGTAKPSAAEMAIVPHHFIGTHSIEEEYSAGMYAREVLPIIHQILQRKRSVILCGGSGLYIKAVCEGFDDMPVVPPGTREKIMAEYHEKGINWLQRQLEVIDPDYFAQVDRSNPHRLIRALELNIASGKTLAALRKAGKADHPFDIIKIGLELDRDELFGRIDQRMDQMIANGLFEEAERFYPLKHLQALQTVGYQEIFDFLDGKYDREEAIRLLKRNSRRYAKRQMTWFRKDKQITWFHPDELKSIIRFVHEQLDSRKIKAT